MRGRKVNQDSWVRRSLLVRVSLRALRSLVARRVAAVAMMVARKVAVTVTSAHGLQGRKVAVSVMSVRDGPESKGVPVASGVNFTVARVARVARQGANSVGRRVRAGMRVGDHRAKADSRADSHRAKAGIRVGDHRAKAGSRGVTVLEVPRARAISRVLEVVRVRGVAALKGVADSSVTRDLRASGNT